MHWYQLPETLDTPGTVTVTPTTLADSVYGENERTAPYYESVSRFFNGSSSESS